ncbi:MAG: glycerophosphodiester phosphodiesterase [Myxococcota bacterium]
MMHPFFDLQRPIIMGHRGAAGDNPENTLLSFESALAAGAQIIESDIQLSSDGVPILLHDSELERTTNGHGLAAKTTWLEIQALDAGAHFQHEDGSHPFREQGIGVPSLEEAFRRFPEARFNLEIKSPDEEATRATLELVQRFDREDRTLLSAGEDNIMQGLRVMLETIPVQPATGACLSEIVETIRSATKGTPIPSGVMALQVPADFAGQPLVTTAFVDHAHSHDIQVHVWTINDLDQIRALLDLGVDGIITDYPGRMHEWLNRDHGR